MYSAHIVPAVMTMHNIEVLDCRGTGPLSLEDMTHILTACKRMHICFFTALSLQHARAEWVDAVQSFPGVKFAKDLHWLAQATVEAELFEEVRAAHDD